MTQTHDKSLPQDERMTRPVLDFADTLYPGLRNKRTSECTPEESIVAGIAWMADNSEYGIDDAARKLIDEFRVFLSARSHVGPTTLVLEQSSLTGHGEPKHPYPQTYEAPANWQNRLGPWKDISEWVHSLVAENDRLKGVAPSATATTSYLPGLRLAVDVLKKNGFEKSALAIGVQIRYLLADPALDKPSVTTDGGANNG